VFKNRPIFCEIPSSERKVLPLLRAAIAIGSTPVQRKWHNKKCELGGSDAGRGSGRGFAADGGQQLTRKQRISSEIQSTYTHTYARTPKTDDVQRAGNNDVDRDSGHSRGSKRDVGNL